MVTLQSTKSIQMPNNLGRIEPDDHLTMVLCVKDAVNMLQAAKDLMTEACDVAHTSPGVPRSASIDLGVSLEKIFLLHQELEDHRELVENLSPLVAA